MDQQIVDGETYWFSPQELTPTETSPTAHLLPAYDEYTIAYKDHRAILDPQYTQQVIAGNGIVIIVDGHTVGTWRRTIKKDTVVLTLNPFTTLTEAENQAIAVAVQQYGAFLELPVVLA